MNAICRLCLCVAFVISCVSAWADEKPSPKRSEYEQFIQPYMETAPQGWFPGPENRSEKIVHTSNVQVRLKLVVTAIEGDEPQAKGQEPIFFRESTPWMPSCRRWTGSQLPQ